VKKSTGKPTKAQQKRFERLKQLGCIACRKEGLVIFPVEIHHMNLGGKAGQKRLGHDFTIPLCAWHHRGTNVHPGGVCLTLTLGPSLAKQSKLFRETYGTDDELLAEVNAMLAA
jgi:hypothetical protein